MSTPTQTRATLPLTYGDFTRLGAGLAVAKETLEGLVRTAPREQAAAAGLMRRAALDIELVVLPLVQEVNRQQLPKTTPAEHPLTLHMEGEALRRIYRKAEHCIGLLGKLAAEYPAGEYRQTVERWQQACAQACAGFMSAYQAAGLPTT